MYLECIYRGDNTPHNLTERNYKKEIEALQGSRWGEVSQCVRHAPLVEAYHKAKLITEKKDKA